MQLPTKTRKLIELVREDQDFQKLQYYMHAMKKAPHGGVFQCTCPSSFIEYPIQAFRLLAPHSQLPYPLKEFKCKLETMISSICITDEELLEFCFRPDKNDSTDSPLAGNKLYAAYASKTLSVKDTASTSFVEAVSMATDGEVSFSEVFTFDHGRLYDVLLCLLLGLDISQMSKLEDVLALESLRSQPAPDKYGLTDISSAMFERQGYCIWGKYYLYNIFFDTSVGGPDSTAPKTIETMRSISGVSILMRCDETLSVPVKEKVSTATKDLQKMRGITIDIRNIDKQVLYHKEPVVHFDPETMHKILLVFSPRDGFIECEIEQLWNPDLIDASKQDILTTYIHGCYYPERATFDHIDFSVNQYNRALYTAKYRDGNPKTATSIEAYADRHYKVWCIKAPKITMENWVELVMCTLDESFRPLFVEAIGVELKPE